MTIFKGRTPKIKLPKLSRIGISQPNLRNCKIAIYRSPTKIFASNFTDKLNTKGKNPKWVKGVGK